MAFLLNSSNESSYLIFPLIGTIGRTFEVISLIACKRLPIIGNALSGTEVVSIRILSTYRPISGDTYGLISKESLYDK